MCLAPFKSETVTFLIGKEKTPFSVHLDVLILVSDYFRPLFTSGLQESRSRTVEYPASSEEDFHRFCQYAYRGDYVPPGYTLDPEPERDAVDTKPEPDMAVTPPTTDPDSLWYSQAPKASKKTSGYQARAEKRFRQLSYPTAALGQQYIATCEAQPHREDRQNFTDAFLAHGRLYAFAKRKLADGLANLCLQKLHNTLLQFKPSERRYDDIVTLTRYAFTDEIDEVDEPVDLTELQRLVAVYHASQFKKIGGFSAFLRLTNEIGCFAEQFIQAIHEDFSA